MNKKVDRYLKAIELCLIIIIFLNMLKLIILIFN